MMANEHLATGTKRLVAAWGLVFGLVACVLFAGTDSVVTATKPDTGTYDELTDLAQEACWGSVAPQPVPWKVGNAESAGCAHVR